MINNYKCLVELYKGQCNPNNPNICVNPDGTYEENIADQLGVRWAYNAFKKYTLRNLIKNRPKSKFLLQLSDDQQFFVNLAQTMNILTPWDSYITYDSHAPAPVRCWRTLANFPAFANAFNCPKDSVFNSKVKCPLFAGDLEK
ncbi:unnamed protein product [Bursaphelenchus okinawaensis]|uniref:Peptidase M13 C-terminal domain-containing protein n=1 Tax=Bursaphelenchus okinawaensis TaxID=465554 RepID=A0A811LBZ3_9BILA|nr:unnamed protein product [Bursaphelenchus okinawaensis]CAG9121216.1 unnamed protein product [Bursaphelenchus okinawaensis]